jgi:hypothetical protein
MTASLRRARLREPAVYVFVLLIAMLTRLTTLSEGFWIDEVMSAAIISDPWSLMLTRIGFTDVHPPGYYMVLKAWSVLWGDSDLALRSLSMIAGLGTLLLVMGWLRTRAGWSVALFGGVLLACSPFHSHYSVEVRAYALVTLAALALAWRLERWLAAPCSRGLWSLVALEVLTLSLHYYGWLWVALLNLYVFGTDRLREPGWRKEWLKGQYIALVALAAWLPLLFVQLFELPEVMKAHLSDALPLTRIIAALGPFPSFEPSVIATSVGGAIVMLAFAGAWLIRSEGQDAVEVSSEAPSPAGLGLAIFIAAGVLVMPLFALIVLPMSDSLLEAYIRQLPWAYAAIAVVVSLGGLAAWARPLRVRPPLVAWLMVGGPLLVLVMHQLQPMLFLRNLLVFMPLVVLCASWSLCRAPVGLHIVLSLLVLSVAGAQFDQGSEGFMPRQDFAGAAAALVSVTDGPVLVAPGWDAAGLSRYASGQRIVPVMSTDEVARAAHEEKSLVVLLGRPDRFALTEQEVEAELGPSWRREQTKHFRGHRGAMRWSLYRRRDDAQSAKELRPTGP